MWNGELSNGEFFEPFETDFIDVLANCCEDAEQSKRPFCEKCNKLQILCICSRFTGIVENKTRITILQHPLEKDHPVGSARVALLGLGNVGLITVPELDPAISYRVRPKVPGSKRSTKVPGSKRSTIGRDGKKIQFIDRVSNFVDDLMRSETSRESEAVSLCNHSAERIHLEDILFRLESGKKELSMESLYIDHQRLCRSVLFEVTVPPGVALLYPSDRAVDLSSAPLPVNGYLDGKHPKQEGEGCVNHLIILDGTWAKAKRMYYENPWLQALPHFRLPTTSPSLYEGVRRQPKLGCLSTLESIVHALLVLEPETQGLEGLLQVFDSMVEDHRRCKALKFSAQNT